ncbi:hypothetical protein PCS_01252 [Desulfocurvibacter africanus PCS]|uniref:Uncharacterized protein n=1 Tax=Desulfocurvibacter africanus PCS TaxID=1262666 RepID=M5PUW2_DESAF|nr:hypothetical protein PCS_01252 [Desulfocurvibacter africanus PCS]
MTGRVCRPLSDVFANKPYANRRMPENKKRQSGLFPRWPTFQAMISFTGLTARKAARERSDVLN